MPHLTADALETDRRGLAFLRAVLHARTKQTVLDPRVAKLDEARASRKASAPEPARPADAVPRRKSATRP
jgi:hypothetical protein